MKGTFGSDDSSWFAVERTCKVVRDPSTGKESFKSTGTTIRDSESREARGVRVADVAPYMLSRLQVPAPILNLVVFCHQEQSAWPLDEGKQLKERFDAIFGADQYSKVRRAERT